MAAELGGTFEGRILVDDRAIRTVTRGVNGPVFRELVEAGEILKAGAKRRVGVDTGKLRDSIVKRVVQGPKGVEIWVGSEEDYAALHHDGTPPHTILPKKPGGVLTFVIDGTRIFTRSVNHPGTKPNRFLTDSIADLRGRY